jgi:hypothetical protein
VRGYLGVLWYEEAGSFQFETLYWQEGACANVKILGPMLRTEFDEPLMCSQSDASMCFLNQSTRI